MKAILTIALFLLIFHGCGGSSEPAIQIKESLEVAEVKEVVQVEKNITTTHIRVLEIDQMSKIPEHLIKIPIHQNQK